ncbi:MAG: ABC transporter substrate-binding protein [Acidimicrobiales bacterium]
MPDDLALVDDTTSTTAALEPGLPSELRIELRRPDTWTPQLVRPVDVEGVVVADLLYDGLVEADASSQTLRGALARSWAPEEGGTRWRFAIDTSRISADAVADHYTALIGERATLPAAMLAHVSAVSAEGDDVVFQLTRADAGLAWLLSGVAYSVVGADGAATGAFAVTERDDGFDLAALESGDQVQSVTVDFVDDAEALSASSVSTFWVLNSRAGAMADLATRQAVVGALDRPSVMPDGSVAADGVVGPAMAGHVADACAVVCDGTPGVALEVDGVPRALSVGYVSESQGEIVAKAVVDLEAAGAAVEVRLLTSAELVAAMDAGEVDLVLAGWAALAGSADAVVPALLSSGSPLNLVGASTPEAETLLLRAALRADDAERWELLHEAQRVMLAEAVILPLSVSEAHSVQVDGDVEVPVRADGSLDLG